MSDVIIGTAVLQGATLFVYARGDRYQFVEDLPVYKKGTPKTLSQQWCIEEVEPGTLRVTPSVLVKSGATELFHNEGVWFVKVIQVGEGEDASKICYDLNRKQLGVDT